MRHIAVAGLQAVAIGLLAGGLILTLTGYYGGFPDGFAHFSTGVLANVLYGSLPALIVAFVYGVPSYALLSLVGWANVVTAIVFGALPYAILAIASDQPWVWRHPVLVNGVAIAIAYHLARRAHGRPSNPAPQPTAGRRDD